MGFKKEINAALPAVAAACGLCVAAGETATAKAWEKDDGSPVTAADYAAQFVLTKAIREVFPQDEILAEETPRSLSGERGEEMLANILRLLPETGKSEFLETLGEGGGDANAGRFWTVDPIDGTAGFISGGQFAVAAALVEDGVPAVGLLGCPGLGIILFASRENGLYRTRTDGSGAERMGIPKPRKEKTVLCETARGSRGTYLQSEKIRDGLPRRTETVRMDSQCKYALLAGGEADVFVRVPNAGGRKESVWDHAAGAAIVSGVGGKVSDFDGEALDFSHGKTLRRNRGIVAAGREIHGEVISAILKAGL